MPHTLAIILRAVFIWLLMSSLPGCSDVQQESRGSADAPLQTDIADETMEGFARKVVGLIAQRRIRELAGLVHPHKGLLLSPYGYIDRVHAITLTERQLQEAWQQNSEFTWGMSDGSGEPVTCTIKDFFDEYLYGVDYLNADEVRVNRVAGQGTTMLNIETVFPDADFVEFHFPGFYPQYQGLDWRSLRIVLEKNADTGWWVVAILNDQWTI